MSARDRPPSPRDRARGSDRDGTRQQDPLPPLQRLLTSSRAVAVEDPFTPADREALEKEMRRFSAEASPFEPDEIGLAVARGRVGEVSRPGPGLPPFRYWGCMGYGMARSAG